MVVSLGIDVSKDSLSVALLDGDKAQPRMGEFPNSPAGHHELLQWLEPLRGAGLRATMEATSTYHRAIATALYETGYTVIVANPLAVKHYARACMRRTKTDPVDARVLARFGREERDSLHPWSPRPQAEAELLELVRFRGGLTKHRTAIANQARIRQQPAARASLKRQNAWYKAEIARVDKDIAAHLRAHPELERDVNLVQSLPGVGRPTATLLRAELGDPRRFNTPGQVSAYAGLTPESRQSGVSLRAPDKLCRIGNQALRTGIYMSAVVLFRLKTLFGDFIRRMIAEGRPTKTILIALARKLLVLAWGVLRSGEPYDPGRSRRESADAAPAEVTSEEPQTDTTVTVSAPEATIPTRGETEAGPAGEHPAKGYPRGAQRSRAGQTQSRSARLSPSSESLPMPPKTQTAPTYG